MYSNIHAQNPLNFCDQTLDGSLLESEVAYIKEAVISDWVYVKILSGTLKKKLASH
jgi:hypothetical protein